MQCRSDEVDPAQFKAFLETGWEAFKEAKAAAAAARAEAHEESAACSQAHAGVASAPPIQPQVDAKLMAADRDALSAPAQAQYQPHAVRPEKAVGSCCHIPAADGHAGGSESSRKPMQQLSDPASSAISSAGCSPLADATGFPLSPPPGLRPSYINSPRLPRLPPNF